MTSSVVMSVTAGAEMTEVPDLSVVGACGYGMNSDYSGWTGSGYASFSAEGTANFTVNGSDFDTLTSLGSCGIQFYFGDTLSNYGEMSDTQILSGDISYTIKSGETTLAEGTTELKRFKAENATEFTNTTSVDLTSKFATLDDFLAATITVSATVSELTLSDTSSIVYDTWELNDEEKPTITLSGQSESNQTYAIPTYEIDLSKYTDDIANIESVTVNYTTTGTSYTNGGIGCNTAAGVWGSTAWSASTTSVTHKTEGVEGKLQFQTYYCNEPMATITIDSITVTEKAATPTTYPITIEGPFANGKVTSDKEEAAAGEKVTLTVTPAENYQLKADALIVTVEAGVEQVDVTDNKNGTYSFTMPECNVAVYAEFITREYKLTAKKTEHGTVNCFIVNTRDAEGVAPAGVEVEISASAEKYYMFGSADIEGVTTKTTSTITETTFTMPAEDVIVTPKFVVDVDYVKLLVDPSVENYATVTKPSTYTVADYKAEIEKKVANLEFNDITVDVSALKETKSTTDATGSITGTVTFKAGEETITTLTANVTLDKAPTDPVDVAKEAVEAYLAKVTFDNDFHATNQSEAIKAEVAKVAPDVRVDASFTVKLATEEAEGSVKGRIMLVADDSELKTIEVNKTIAKLPAKDLVYADNQGMLVALKADGTVLTQKATQANGKISQRFVKKITKADLEGAKEIQYKFSDGTKSLTKTDKFYYETVAGVPSGETEVFLSATMKNIPVGAKVNCEITIIK